ncbi:MAG: Holliday junction branch migration protein RuvA [Candidatus Peregrinibacteria bacterium]|nr:Holliday junction branch migration protein RuvA [Candidatus Peregrinibacteria bacterium]MCB9808209.1 Holliday junction branch migration protein RuvA [Candidatus Peribacteria bacterium]
MIATLRGIVHRQSSEEVTIEVGGIGYRVLVPITVWDELQDEQEALLHIHTYVREDRFDLFGFLTRNDKALFERFINMSGIGPRHALELSAVPKSLLMQAIGTQEPKLLTSVKGIGKKTAEKLLVDLKSLAEKQPEIFEVERGKWKEERGLHDQDVIDALKNLGYDTSSIMNVLKDLPSDLETSEERVAAALKQI